MTCKKSSGATPSVIVAETLNGNTLAKERESREWFPQIFARNPDITAIIPPPTVIFIDIMCRIKVRIINSFNRKMGAGSGVESASGIII